MTTKRLAIAAALAITLGIGALTAVAHAYSCTTTCYGNTCWTNCY